MNKIKEELQIKISLECKFSGKWMLSDFASATKCLTCNKQSRELKKPGVS